MIQSWHAEPHFISRVGWLGASVLGANDGIVSTASLVVGVAGARSFNTGWPVSAKLFACSDHPGARASATRADILEVGPSGGDILWIGMRLGR